MRREISELIHSKGGAFANCSPQDFEFIRVSQKSAQVPATKPGFEWNGSAIKGLAAQGSLYVRLTRAFEEPSDRKLVGNLDEGTDGDFEPTRVRGMPTQSHKKTLQSRPSTLGVTGKQTPTSPITVPSADSSEGEDELPAIPSLTCRSVHDIGRETSTGSIHSLTCDPKPAWSVPKAAQSTTDKVAQLTDMFPDATSMSICAILDVCGSDMLLATERLLSSPSLRVLLNEIREKHPLGERLRLEVDEDDEETLFSDTIALYKSPHFNFCSDLRVRFRNQPAVDTGGVRRHLFTDVFRLVATSSAIGLFEGELPCVHFRYSVQNVMSSLAEIVGKMIAHALILEGIGFPYLSPAVYCYLATGDRNRAMQCISTEDVCLPTQHLVVRVNS